MTLNLPAPDTTQLAHSPLEVVVAQVRHERRLVVSESSTARAVHEALGGSDGPYAFIDEVTAASTLNLVFSGASAPGGVAESQLTGWRLRDAEGAWVVTLMPDHFGLETTAYTTWEADFAPRLQALIDAVREHVRPAFEQRVGLRYVDRITDPEVREVAGWREHIRQEVLGVICHPELGDAVRVAQQQAVFELGDGVVCTLRHGPVPDNERKTIPYLLDFDVFREGGRGFDGEQLHATFEQFNISAVQLFQATITSALLSYLRAS